MNERIEGFLRVGRPLTWTLLRVVVGLIMAVHGWMKAEDITAWAGNLEAMGVPLPTLNAYLSIAGELLGGLGLMVGLLTPVAALGVVGTMAVAVFVVHFPNGLLAQKNGFEYPLTLLCAGLFFLVNGAGSWSLDAWIQCRRSGHECSSRT